MKAYIKPDALILEYPYDKISIWPADARTLFDVAWQHSSTEIGYWECRYNSLTMHVNSMCYPIRVYGLQDILPESLTQLNEAPVDNKNYVTSPGTTYNYDLSEAPKGAKALVLNQGFSTSVGQVTGNRVKDYGIIAWATMPVRDKEMEVFLGHLPVLTGHPALKEN